MARQIPLPEITMKFNKYDIQRLMRNTSRLEEEVIRSISNLIFEAADYLIAYIRESWSGLYPPASTPGYPPAIRSGNLDTTVEKSMGYARDRYGRFAERGKATQVRISIDTVRGGGQRMQDKEISGKHRDYAYYLELGTRPMQPRPFLDPAAEHLAIKFPQLAGKVKVHFRD